MPGNRMGSRGSACCLWDHRFARLDALGPFASRTALPLGNYSASGIIASASRRLDAYGTFHCVESSYRLAYIPFRGIYASALFLCCFAGLSAYGTFHCVESPCRFVTIPLRGIVTTSFPPCLPCRPCRRRRPSGLPFRACLPRRIRWSGPWRRRKPRSAARNGSPWQDRRCRLPPC